MVVRSEETVFISQPVGSWVNYTEVQLNPFADNSYSVVISNQTTIFTLDTFLCASITQNGDEYICNSYPEQCHIVEISQLACPEIDVQPDNNLRLESYEVGWMSKADGELSGRKDFDYPISLVSKSIRIFDNDDLLLFCSNFQWVEQNTDSALSSKVTFGLSTLALLTILLQN